jgi:hypothetical protein
MLEVADVFRLYGDAYLQQFGQTMPPSHRRALDDIRHCRTEVLGGHVYGCDRCGHRQYAYHSCKNRSCPKCQGDDAEVWMERRQQELLAVPYFHVVFTLPQELRPIVRRHQKTLYGVLMKAAARALMKLAEDPRYVGGQLGILAVLHTWTTTLAYHPHVHCLVPAGGVTEDSRWVAARKSYLVPVDALALLFRGIFLGLLRKAFPRQHVPHSVWTKSWVVYCKPAVQGSERVLQYLARYVHRIALANSRLVRVEDGQVTFRYQVRKEHQWKTMTLPAAEFIRRFLQHVLPRGTHKVRYYGFWNPSHRALLRQIQLVTGSAEPCVARDDTATTSTDKTPAESSETPRKCPRCGEGILILIETIPRHTRAPP